MNQILYLSDKSIVILQREKARSTVKKIKDALLNWRSLIENMCNVLSKYRLVSLSIFPHHSLKQCCGSGTVCFWTTWIRIRHYFVRIRILPSTSKKSKKNLDFYYFVTAFWLFISESDNWYKNVPSKLICKKTYLLASCHPLTKKADPNPDPDP